MLLSVRPEFNMSIQLVATCIMLLSNVCTEISGCGRRRGKGGEGGGGETVSEACGVLYSAVSKSVTIYFDVQLNESTSV